MSRNGLHHVTAIAGPAQRNLDFHTRVLGQRLVKKTVNFDDPGTYHFYYGDETGAPGTILTFFPFEQAAPGVTGAGETMETAFRIPASAVAYWADRLTRHGATPQTWRRFGQTVLTFADPDGMRLALVALPGLESEPAWSNGDVPAEVALRGLHGVTILVRDAEPTARILQDVFGYEEAAREDGVRRLVAKDSHPGGFLDIVEAPSLQRGRQGTGSVHHLAFRAGDDAEQERMTRRLAEKHGLHATEQRDRNYFRSVYFREPGGVLFEIATDSPGFPVDEDVRDLGASLKLPGFLEPHRARIEAVLPALA